jgi:hypothetical protein
VLKQALPSESAREARCNAEAQLEPLQDELNGTKAAID